METKEDMKKAATTSLQKQGENGSGKKADIYALIQRQTPGFKMALPKDFDADRFTRLVLTALKSNPKLSQCTPASILAAVMLSAQAGLEPNTPLHEASIIPYNNKKGETEAQFQIEYRGLLKLVYNSGLVTRVDYDKVCENDQFTHKKGFDEKFEHEPLMKGERGKAYAYYAMAELIGGGRALIVKTVDDIKKHAARFSRAYGQKYESSPWQTDFDAMAIKTCLKELCDKKLPKRTTNEALKFHQLVARDETVARLTPEQLTAIESGELVKAEDVQAEETNFTEVTNGDSKETTPAEAEKYNDPNYWIDEIQSLRTIKGVDEFEENFKKELQAFGGEDAERIQKALLERRSQLSKKAKE